MPRQRGRACQTVRWSDDRVTALSSAQPVDVAHAVVGLRTRNGRECCKSRRGWLCKTREGEIALYYGSPYMGTGNRASYGISALATSQLRRI
jgi:hypothetical protein